MYHAPLTLIFILPQAWKEGNYTVAEYMSQKISDDDQRLALVTPQLRELLVVKYYQIGRSILKEPNPQEGKRIEDAVTWLQKSVALVDQLDDAAGAGIPDLKVGVPESQSRAYFLSGAYDRAEAALEELMPGIDAQTDHASSEYQELRWLRLAILKRRKAGEGVLREAYKSIIDHMEFSETNVTELATNSKSAVPTSLFIWGFSALVTAINQYSLEKALRFQDRDPGCVDRLLLSIIFHSAKEDNHARAMETLNKAFTCMSSALLDLELLWQYGERHYNAKRFPEAADWFISGTHQLFRTVSSTTTSKCFRKAALCYIEHQEYARAATVIRRCSTDEATTHYVMFLTAVHQAIKALHDMHKAAGFDRKMLLLATQISHQLEMKGVLLSVLEALLNTLRTGTGSAGEAVVEAMTLIRCIIRLALKLVSEPTANKTALVDIVVKHFRTAQALTKSACEEKSFALINKDVSWLWRAAYNCAIQGCAEWKQCEEQISELFDITRGLLEACCQASPVDLDAEVYVHLINASFSSVSGRVFLVRESSTTNGSRNEDQLRGIAAEITACKSSILEIIGQHKIVEEADITRAQYFIHTLRIFEAEFLVQLKEWDGLAKIVGEAVSSGPLAVGTYEAIADLLWADKDCPINGTYKIL
ncbi:hypothetical protein AMATHDRAFT_152750 [Amanita thiersii Skay4041]|uniref:Protein ZIP4 homolog n=1 Tax=Amanita thiersii Skay4041 TaxID=703135 RepID=A0A2A9NAT5_9AGAR|nr:hypothetical protein AMATHDRAFT_152750 [Amanita thiersii Skay4041]